MCLMDCFQYWLVVELQLGFRKGRGCRDVTFTLQGVIKSINLQGCTATGSAENGHENNGPSKLQDM